MKTVSDMQQLNKMKQENAVFILFGGEHCGVCKTLRSRLEPLLKQDFPDLPSVYIDCEISPNICAQHSVFSLPVVKAYIEGRLIVEENGAFSIKKLLQSIERPYKLWKDAL
ncbi:MAG: thioredoxin family protein [Gammaproteobacteria bacterium]|nr:thioredoxin family protein [Gammaproteobacteria bacterium]